MKLISWNVNGLRACLTHDFAASFAALDADIFSVQETKMQPGQADFAPEGYTEYTYSAEKKVGKLEKFFKEEPEASVTFSVEKKNRCVAEIMLRGANGTLFRAVCEDPDGDMRGAIDEATAQIERKIRKNKTRLAKNLRAEAVMPELPEEFEAHEEGTFDIVRTKRFTVKPMSVEEAILQMNLLGHSFFVFRNTDFGDAICVVYRRNNGGYGIIETEDDEE